MKDEHEARRKVICERLRTTRIATQEDLRRELKRRGFLVTQATLSRDLAHLRAHRVSEPAGSYYVISDEAPVSDAHARSATAEMVLAVDESHALVIVLTTMGAASVVAADLDRARLVEVLGTIAGDDTIFVAPKASCSVKALATKLSRLWGKGARPSRSQPLATACERVNGEQRVNRKPLVNGTQLVSTKPPVHGKSRAKSTRSKAKDLQ